MDFVNFRILFCDGSERIQANMQCNIRDFHSFDLQLFEQSLREMEASRRSGGRARLTRVDGLIAFWVIQLFMNIWRERDIPNFGKVSFDRFRKFYQSL